MEILENGIIKNNETDVFENYNELQHGDECKICKVIKNTKDKWIRVDGWMIKNINYRGE